MILFHGIHTDCMRARRESFQDFSWFPDFYAIENPKFRSNYAGIWYFKQNYHEGCIIILLAHGQGLVSVLTRPHTTSPFTGKHKTWGLSDIWLPIQPRGLKEYSGLIPVPAIVIIQMDSGLAGFYFLW